MTTKFKIGDKVRVKSIEWFSENAKVKCMMPECMKIHCGEVMNIHWVRENYYLVKENGFGWQDWMLEDEPVAEEKQEQLLKNNNTKNMKNIFKKYILPILIGILFLIISYLIFIYYGVVYYLTLLIIMLITGFYVSNIIINKYDKEINKYAKICDDLQKLLKDSQNTNTELVKLNDDLISDNKRLLSKLEKFSSIIDKLEKQINTDNNNQ
jgi:hypothetical protein